MTTGYTLDPTQRSMQRSKRNWAKNVLGEALRSDEMIFGYRRKLLEIGMAAELTTYIGDYDPQPDGIKLSLLAGLPGKVVDNCLRSLDNLGNSYIHAYVQQFRESQTA